MPESSEVDILAPEAVAAVEAALRSYASELTANFASSTQAQPEDQLKAPVGSLLRAAGLGLNFAVVTRTEVRVEGVGGRPDLGVDVDALPAGNVELKKPGHGAEPDRFPDARSREQWERFKALPNLIYTDGRDWALYRSGEMVGEVVRLTFDPTRDGAAGVKHEDASRLAQVLSVFFDWEPVVPVTAKGVAGLLAPITRVLRDEVLADVRADGVMARLADEWRATLFPDADDLTFADGYAQTFTYALLLARLEGAQAPLTAHAAATELEADHALLAQTLLLLGQRQAREAIGMPVGLLERLIGAVDPVKLNRGKDPWLYFYEDFLAEYDPEQRNNRGVYFTPHAVVDCQVRLAQHTLTNRFEKPNGFGAEDVVVLDPATGTGTYLLTVVKSALEQVEPYGAGIVAETASILSNNLNGFELLVGPYAVAHLRLSRALTDAGATISSSGVNVFLTDTLSAPVNAGFSQQASLFQQTLAEEQERASRVKSPETRVTVVIGNPPYDRDTSGSGAGERRKGGMVRYSATGDGYGLISDFRDPLPSQVLGQHGLNLFNDYVYFWRWAIWKACQQNDDASIVSFITPSSYLTGPVYGGMREVMRRQFDEVWLIDLGGEGRGTRKDDNVFDGVLSPVVIGMGVRLPGWTPERANTPAAVRYRRITGTQAEKYEHLQSLTPLEPSDDWSDVPEGWQDAFIPPGQSEYATWTDVIDLFPWTARGIQFSRTWPVSEDKATLTTRWNKLIAAAGTPGQATLLKTSGDRTVDRSIGSFLVPGRTLEPLKSLSPGDLPDGIEKIAFRSFDRQWCVADYRVIDRARPPLWRIRGQKQIYFTTATTETTIGPALAANTAVPDLNAFNNRGGLCLPLYRDAEGAEPNLPTELLNVLSTKYEFLVSADDLAAYVFGLLGTGAYAERFSEGIAESGIRVPITADPTLFAEVRDFGRSLLWWSTFGERFEEHDAAGNRMGIIPPSGIQNTVPVPAEGLPETVAYDSATQTLKLGAGEFAPVSQAVWDFEVSGLKVVQSWIGYRLQRRAGRTSSDLDKERPAMWTSSRELLDLLSVVDHIINMTPVAATLIERVADGDLIPSSELPTPNDSDRQAPTFRVESESEPQQLELG